MIEVNLYSIPAGEHNVTVGKCVARNRFDKEAMGTTIEDFVKGFLKENFDKIEASVGISELSDIVNSEAVLSRKDLATLNYYLINAGYMFQVVNVAEDEDNPTGIPSGEVVEWNVIDNNFVQFDYPTCTKIIPAAGQDIPSILKQVATQAGIFGDKFSGLKNPLTDIFTNIERIKNISGSINSGLVSRVYEILDQVGIKIFCATSED